MADVLANYNSWRISHCISQLSDGGLMQALMVNVMENYTFDFMAHFKAHLVVYSVAYFMANFTIWLISTGA